MLRAALHGRGDAARPRRATTSPTLMERAGRAVAEEVLRRFPDARVRRGLRRRRERRRRPDRARVLRAEPGRDAQDEATGGGPRDRRALRHRLPRRAARRGGRADRRDQRAPARRCSPSTSLGRERVDRRGRRRRRPRGRDGDDARRARSASRSRRGASTPVRSSLPTSGSSTRDGAPARHARVLGVVPRKRRARQQVHGRLGARRRWRARA